MKRLAQETVRKLGSGVVAIAGTGPDGVKAGVAVAVSKDLIERGVSADAIARPAAKALGGGVGKGADAVVGGGPNADGLDEALRLVARAEAHMGVMTHCRAVCSVSTSDRCVSASRSLIRPGRSLRRTSVLQRGREHGADHRAIAEIVGEHEVTTIVVGLPLSLSGAKGPAARAAEAEIEELRGAVGDGIEVVAHDERLTTVTAERSLDEARVPPRRSRGRRRQDRGRRDAAVVAGIVFESDPAMITGEDVAQSEPSSGGPRRTRRRPRRRGRITAVIIAVVLIPFLVFGTSVAWFLLAARHARIAGQGGAGAVQPGWGVPRIGEELHRDHVIGSSLVFNIYARFNGDNSFQAGTYDLHTRIGVRDAVAALKRGPADQLRGAQGAARAVAETDCGSRRQDAGPQRAGLPAGGAQQLGAIEIRAGRGVEPRGSGAARHVQDLELPGRDLDPPDAGDAPSTAGPRSSGWPPPTSTATVRTRSSPWPR